MPVGCRSSVAAMRRKIGFGIAVLLSLTLVLALAVLRRPVVHSVACHPAAGAAHPATSIAAGEGTKGAAIAGEFTSAELVKKSAVVHQNADAVAASAGGPGKDGAASAGEASGGTQAVWTGGPKLAGTPHWAGPTKGQLLRPTDFSKLTEALKGKQALATGLDEAAVRAELEKRSLTGDAEAALTLGLMLRYGDTATDKAQGAKLISAAAEAGNTRAMAEWGRVLLADESSAGSATQADDWLRRAWAAGENEGAFLLASAQRLGMLKPAEGESSQYMLLAAARQGNESAQRLLVSQFNESEGGATKEQVWQWTEAMAQGGDTVAMMARADQLATAGDFASAVPWLERAAGNGSVDAIMVLALMARQGQGGPQAMAAAVQHLSTQLESPTTATADASYALALLLAMQAKDQTDVPEVLRHLREAGAQGHYHAALAARMIDTGAELSDAMAAVLKMDEKTAYVRYIEASRTQPLDSGPTEAWQPDATPRPLHVTEPLYPAELLAARTMGDVTVQFIVLDNGTVDDCRIVASDHPAFAAAATEALQQWRFQPGVKDGKPVATRLQIRFPFRGRQ
jgi:TonB family protein